MSRLARFGCSLQCNPFLLCLIQRSCLPYIMKVGLSYEALQTAFKALYRLRIQKHELLAFHCLTQNQMADARHHFEMATKLNLPVDMKSTMENIIEQLPEAPRSIHPDSHLISSNEQRIQAIPQPGAFGYSSGETSSTNRAFVFSMGRNNNPTGNKRNFTFQSQSHAAFKVGSGEKDRTKRRKGTGDVIRRFFHRQPELKAEYDVPTYDWQQQQQQSIHVPASSTGIGGSSHTNQHMTISSSAPQESTYKSEDGNIRIRAPSAEDSSGLFTSGSPDIDIHDIMEDDYLAELSMRTNSGKSEQNEGGLSPLVGMSPPASPPASVHNGFADESKFDQSQFPFDFTTSLNIENDAEMGSNE